MFEQLVAQLSAIPDEVAALGEELIASHLEEVASQRSLKQRVTTAICLLVDVFMWYFYRDYRVGHHRKLQSLAAFLRVVLFTMHIVNCNQTKAFSKKSAAMQMQKQQLPDIKYKYLIKTCLSASDLHALTQVGTYVLFCELIIYLAGINGSYNDVLLILGG